MKLVIKQMPQETEKEEDVVEVWLEKSGTDVVIKSKNKRCNYNLDEATLKSNGKIFLIGNGNFKPEKY